MSLTQAQYDVAYSSLAAINESDYQNATAVVLIESLQEYLKSVTNYQDLMVFITDRSILELQKIVNEFIYTWSCNPKRGGYKFFKEVGVEVVASIERESSKYKGIEFRPNGALLQLLNGTAPVRLFNPTREAVESMWTEELQTCSH